MEKKKKESVINLPLFINHQCIIGIKVKKTGSNIELVKARIQRFRGPADSIGGFDRNIIKYMYSIIYTYKYVYIIN